MLAINQIDKIRDIVLRNKINKYLFIINFIIIGFLFYTKYYTFQDHSFLILNENNQIKIKVGGEVFEGKYSDLKLKYNQAKINSNEVFIENIDNIIVNKTINENSKKNLLKKIEVGEILN